MQIDTKPDSIKVATVGVCCLRDLGSVFSLDCLPYYRRSNKLNIAAHPEGIHCGGSSKSLYFTAISTK